MKIIFKDIFTISIFSFYVFLFSCGDKKDGTGGTKKDEQSIYTNIKHPIILVAGYGSKSTLWEESGMVSHLTEKGDLTYGGKLMLGENGISCSQELTGKVDFFDVVYSDSTTSINALTKEMDQYIQFVLNYTNAGKVMLVGYSLGGVVCRNYVVENQEEEKVKTLVSIASPHQGSYLANLVYGTKLITGGYSSKLLKLLFDQPVDGLAVPDLIDSGAESFLYQLNHKQHPKYVNYISFVARSDFSLIQQKALKSLTEGILYEGDWVVEASSQDMKNIPALKSMGSTYLKTFTIEEANHFDVLEKNTEIYDGIKMFVAQR